MKRITSLLLTAVLLCTMMTVFALPASADSEEKYDTITFESVNSKKSDNGLFTLDTNRVTSNGWWCGEGKYRIKILGESGLEITRIEAEIVSNTEFYKDVAISHGNIQEKKWIENIFIVTDIDSRGFYFDFDSERFYTFKDIKVYYTDEASNTASIISNGYPEILYGIGGLAVGFIAAMLIFRKKKVAVSSTADHEE